MTLFISAFCVTVFTYYGVTARRDTPEELVEAIKKGIDFVVVPLLFTACFCLTVTIACLLYLTKKQQKLIGLETEEGERIALFR